ncbi:hypothetical protein CTA1_5709 [Colletotrichum tanaceti]|uniref:Uncharacterized protein n=1 Tax=Colletotrichum tanaceti TaxID=1306861 RepID=A0A4U6X3L7_9PEZI|nr:hypothetical protein CTA1_5709 [Colletotrichum tanaceti]
MYNYTCFRFGITIPLEAAAFIGPYLWEDAAHFNPEKGTTHQVDTYLAREIAEWKSEVHSEGRRVVGKVY